MSRSFRILCAACLLCWTAAIPPVACATTYTLGPTVSGVIYPWSGCFADTVVPGDVILLSPQTSSPYYRAWISFYHFEGTENSPITIANNNSLVKLRGTAGNAGIGFVLCDHIVLSGRGGLGGSPGLEVEESGHHGIRLERSDAMEIDFIAVHDCTHAGVLATGNESGTSNYFAFADLSVHDLVISECETGLYLGTSSGGAALDTIMGLEVYANEISDIGNRGIQVSGAQGEVLVHHNAVERTGQVTSERQGIMVNPGSSGLWYNNWVADSDGGTGIYVQGIDNDVFNNVIVASADRGIFWLQGGGKCYDNTIVTSTSYSFQAGAGLSDRVTVYDNIAADYGTGVGICTSPAQHLDIYNNLEYADAADAEFVDLANRDFHLTSGADAVGTGSLVGFAAFDFDDVSRPQGRRADIGAFERVSRGESGPASSGGVQIRITAATRESGAAATIRFDLSHSSPAVLRIVDVAGRLVRELENAVLSAGRHESAWDGTDGHGRRVPSGVYFAQLRAQSTSISTKLLLKK